mmetsp:Transcript_51690/g.109915  ORF Transcript_51690/g.109915 Transcript_51690/m.109915 type:complete len:80 (+) Transcript_51690:270-509(+)
MTTGLVGTDRRNDGAAKNERPTRCEVHFSAEDVSLSFCARCAASVPAFVIFSCSESSDGLKRGRPAVLSIGTIQEIVDR